MVAQLIPAPATSTDTARFHCPSELTFLDADDLLNVVHYSAPSKSRPGDANVVALDVLSGATLCNCKAAETGHGCWHQTLAMSAWNGHETRVLASRFNDAQLQAAGAKANRMCRVYRRRIWRCLPDDQTMLLACRCEYRRRRGVVAHEYAA